MPLFYTIRPKSNGCVSLCKNKNGNFVTIQKGVEAFEPKLLMFNTEPEAQEYIKNNLNTDEYITEWRWLANEYICPTCGGDMNVICVVEAQYSISGNTERLCHCRNKACGLSWSVMTDENNKVLNIEQYTI